jgi:hypothetical protein
VAVSALRHTSSQNESRGPRLFASFRRCVAAAQSGRRRAYMSAAARCDCSRLNVTCSSQYSGSPAVSAVRGRAAISHSGYRQIFESSMSIDAAPMLLQGKHRRRRVVDRLQKQVGELVRAVQVVGLGVSVVSTVPRVCEHGPHKPQGLRDQLPVPRHIVEILSHKASLCP